MNDERYINSDMEKLMDEKDVTGLGIDTKQRILSTDDKIRLAIDLLPGYNDDSWKTDIDGIKCDINYVKGLLRSLLRRI